MLNRIFKISIAFAFAFLMMACSEGRGIGTNTVKAVLDAKMSSEESVDETINVVDETQKGVKNPYDNIDIDLTAMPKKLAYSTANRMNMMSEEYLGQIVKMNGICSIFHDEKRDIYFFTCEINDETACCMLGIEFELLDDYKFPEDFPKENEEVTVVGVFDTYKEGARTYKTLRKAVLA